MFKIFKCLVYVCMYMYRFIRFPILADFLWLSASFYPDATTQEGFHSHSLDISEIMKVCSIAILQ